MQQTDQTKRRIGRNFLKTVAVFSMLCDHTAFLLSEDLWLYDCMRAVGRLSFVLFSFVLAQGFLTTHNVKKYIARLFFFAILSEIPFDLAFYGKVIYLGQQNVLFTFLIALLVLAGLERYEENVLIKSIFPVAGCLLAWWLQTDYSYMGVLLVTAFYLFRLFPDIQTGVAGGLLLVSGSGLEIFGLFALPLCYCYSPEKQERPLPKYFFYLFYPGHLLVLGLLQCLL